MTAPALDVRSAIVIWFNKGVLTFVVDGLWKVSNINMENDF
jgi:hypothetical protein